MSNLKPSVGVGVGAGGLGFGVDLGGSGVGVSVGKGVEVRAGVLVGVLLGTRVGVCEAVGVGVSVGVEEAVAVAEGAAVGSVVAVNVGTWVLACATAVGAASGVPQAVTSTATTKSDIVRAANRRRLCILFLGESVRPFYQKTPACQRPLRGRSRGLKKNLQGIGDLDPPRLNLASISIDLHTELSRVAQRLAETGV